MSLLALPVKCFLLVCWVSFNTLFQEEQPAKMLVLCMSVLGAQQAETPMAVPIRAQLHAINRLMHER